MAEEFMQCDHLFRTREQKWPQQTGLTPGNFRFHLKTEILDGDNVRLYKDVCNGFESDYNVTW